MWLQTLLPQLDPLTEQQLVGICNLQQSSQQAEEALSQGLEQLHQSLADTMAGGSLIDDANMSFMGQMAAALGKLANLEGFVIQVMVSHQILKLNRCAMSNEIRDFFFVAILYSWQHYASDNTLNLLNISET